MNIAKKTFIAGLIFILGLSACNLPSQAPPNPLEEAAAAATATLQALTANPFTATNTPVPLETPLPTETGTITPTSTSSVPMVTVSQNTNCRTGPGVVYDLIGALLIGEQAVVVGKYTPGNYWIINNLDAAGTCWLWGQYATVTGNTAGLPEYTPPPTPTPTYTPTATFTPTLAPPAAPENFTANKICLPVGPNFNYQFTLSWNDIANNEDGYRVYFNGSLLATLPANTTTYPHVVGVLGPGAPIMYDVEAFNAAGASAKKSVTVTCP
jgi:hypothetical protein